MDDYTASPKPPPRPRCVRRQLAGRGGGRRVDQFSRLAAVAGGRPPRFKQPCDVPENQLSLLPRRRARNVVCICSDKHRAILIAQRQLHRPIRARLARPAGLQEVRSKAVPDRKCPTFDWFHGGVFMSRYTRSQFVPKTAAPTPLLCRLHKNQIGTSCRCRSQTRVAAFADYPDGDPTLSPCSVGSVCPSAW